MLPVHRPPPRTPSRRSLLPRSRLSTFIVLFLGAITLYSLYHLSSSGPPHPSEWWDRPDRPFPPPPDGHNKPPPPPLGNRPPTPPNPQVPPVEAISTPKYTKEQLLWKSRAEDVKKSFLHAWDSYEAHAWGWDEVRPLSGNGVHNFNGWGVSIVDALDTLLIMDLKPQFARAMEHVESLNFTQTAYEHAPFFETIIRYLGGLLSAYALVVDEAATTSIAWGPAVSASVNKAVHHASPLGDAPDQKREPTRAIKLERDRVANILLTRADHLARALLPAFNTTSGLPVWGVNTVSGTQRPTWSSLLAEIGSCQMEYKYLAHLTGRREYFDAVNNVTNLMEDLQQKQLNNPASTIQGMFPTHFSVSTGMGTDDFISLGSLADSAYEYLLKGYLLSGRTEHRLLDMYLKSMNTALHNLTYISHERDLVYITDARGNFPSHRLEHLACFFPGLLGLGVETLNSAPKNNLDGTAVKVELPTAVQERHKWAAEAIAETCWLMYADNPSGLGSEEIYFDRPPILSDQPTTTEDEYEEEDPDVPPKPSLVPSTPEHNRWMDIVDKWDQAGRPGKNGKPRGIHGVERQKVITNGGKGSWESYNGHPSENERPFETPTPEPLAGGPTRYNPSASRPSAARTHLRDYGVRDNRWLMRPETIESLYIMYRLTRDPIWRDRCYGIYEGMEKHSRTKIGYATVKSVDLDVEVIEQTEIGPVNNDPEESPSKKLKWTEYMRWEDSMPSYALAETFKYMYLCLLDPDESAALLPSDKWVFNTEAHPLPVFDWSETERKGWDIR